MEKKQIELYRVRPGEHFTHDGVEYVKLDEAAGAVFALAVDAVIPNVQFEDDDAEREDQNNYIGSNLEKAGIRWLRDKHKATFDAMVNRPIDLTTMDGMTDYGMPLASVRALTIDEYRKYRHLIPLADDYYWLATGVTTPSFPCSDTDYAYCIRTDGTVYNSDVYLPYFAARPALYLKSSILVSVDAEGEEKVLTEKVNCPKGAREAVLECYTDTDLIDELYRRRMATYGLLVETR